MTPNEINAINVSCITKSSTPRSDANEESRGSRCITSCSASSTQMPFHMAALATKFQLDINQLLRL